MTEPKAFVQIAGHWVELNSCPVCGAIVFDAVKHQKWHEKLTITIKEVKATALTGNRSYYRDDRHKVRTDGSPSKRRPKKQED